jgi:beta-glucosidase-like glycosyl hydrolase
VTSPFAALLVPELRGDPGHGFAHLEAAIDDALAIGVGGFVVSGGTAAQVASLTRELHRRSRHPLLIAADAERGAGEQFAGATGLPPAGALALLRDVDAVRRAARLTARELRAIGVNWALAPVCDLDHPAANPFIGARAFGSGAQRAAEYVVEWIDACQAEGVLACAKHFPGVGRAGADPLVSVAHVDASAAMLWGDDLLPFRGAVDAGVASVLAAHVVVPSLDDSGAPASRSRPVLTEFLRGELAFDGLIVSDALSAEGARFGTDEAAAAVGSLLAGCDLLLAPSDPLAIVEALETAADARQLDEDAIAPSLARRSFRANWALPRDGRDPTLEDVLWARQVADTVVHAVRGVFPNIGPVVDVIQVEDEPERGWRAPPRSREPFFATLRALGLEPRSVDGPTGDGRGSVVVAVHGEPGAGMGRVGYTQATRRRVAEALAAARQARRSAVVLLFGPPHLADALPEATNVICCWSSDRAMLEAAARRTGGDG